MLRVANDRQIKRVTKTKRKVLFLRYNCIKQDYYDGFVSIGKKTSNTLGRGGGIIDK